ncbi:ankyrin repeat domain-containing protein [Shewanella sp. SW36]|nr:MULTISPECIES: ankyrin repeat domain-containing protein [unclassified Shewanella]MCU7976049.1 ankyrin repeat domain-containing protein [Shewanella sp. SW36]MCU7991439.1 ankyrin repeat domain-containing protein [Shewanella sp. SW1]MCU8016682.1 ankyrin repeat domain-containing protein [Shewanella sp. SM72]MCU8052948.1 ankyrin repeat domain-containing protein [Shewanella sp. SM43]
MSTELIDAVKAKDTLAVKRIIANGADLEDVDENAMTALLHACEL